MEWTPYRLMLALTMVTFGSAFTLFSKWTDREVAAGTPGYPRRLFNHPFFQGVAMFLGEALCGVAFFAIMLYQKRQGKSPREALGKMTFNLKEIFTQKGGLSRSFFVFFPPSMCDAIGSSLLFIGLNYTTAASYQMLRGSVIIFTALLSMAFLRRKFGVDRWVGIAIVIGGLIVVGLADFMFRQDSSSTHTTTMVITGDLLIVIDQIFASFQLVLEEKFVDKLDVDPLLAVGLEGFFGAIVLAILAIPMYFIPVGPQFSNSPEYRLEDALDAFSQMDDNWKITFATVGIILVCSIYNWACISIIKYLSATTRAVLDAFRILVIWAFTLAIGWQNFLWLQVIGFFAITCGVFIYNKVLTIDVVKGACKCLKETEPSEKEKPSHEIHSLTVEKPPIPQQNPAFDTVTEF